MRTSDSQLKENNPGSERWFVTGVILIILFLTTLPYLYGYFSAPADKQFMGIMLDVPDHGQYFSWMRELAHAPLAANKLTPEPNRAIFFNLLWWGMGRLGRILGLGFAGVFQILRIVSAVLFLLLLYRVCAWFIKDIAMRKTAFLVAALGSGLGWILVVLKYTLTKGELLFPLDLYVAEPNTFLGILAYPHFIAAALYIFIFDLMLRGQAANKLSYSFWAGLVALFLGWQHAYDLVLVYGILGGYTLVVSLRDRQISPYLVKSLVIIGIISWWPALYSVILTRLDPLWEQVLAQFANAGVYTPNLFHLPILMGIGFILVIFNFLWEKPWRLKTSDNNSLFLWSWFIFNFFFIYIPTDFQIHMLNGWQAPIAILATRAVYQHIAPKIEQWLHRDYRTFLGITLILAVLPTNLYLLAWRFVDLSRHNYPYYLYQQDIAAMKWLEANASPDSIVLSSETTGAYIPAMTGAYAFLAHWAQTLNYYEKSRMVKNFFSSEYDDASRREIISSFSVDYIYYGPAEQALGEYNPSACSWLKPVFESPKVTVFAVKP